MMSKLLLNLWQLPQVLLAYMLIVLWKAKLEFTYKGIKVYRTDKLYGISLGTIIILSIKHNTQVLHHEYGHTRQSLYFGWLYLLIIGLPSIVMNILSTVLYKKGYKTFANNYYKRWPENWADKLGNVSR